MQGLFITGTDTGVGKTWTACSLIHSAIGFGFTVGAYKPACSGAVFDDQDQPHWSDCEELAGALEHRFPLDLIGPQRFVAPLAPPIAAVIEGRCVDYSRILSDVADWHDRCDVLVVEGAGGFFCPLTEDRTFADLAADLGLPVLVVAANRLGVLNHSLLTLDAIRNRGLKVAGLVLCDPAPTSDASSESNLDGLRRYANPGWLGRLQHGETVIQTRDGPLTQVDLNLMLQ